MLSQFSSYLYRVETWVEKLTHLTIQNFFFLPTSSLPTASSFSSSFSILFFLCCPYSISGFYVLMRSTITNDQRDWDGSVQNKKFKIKWKCLHRPGKKVISSSTKKRWAENARVSLIWRTKCQPPNASTSSFAPYEKHKFIYPIKNATLISNYITHVIHSFILSHHHFAR